MRYTKTEISRGYTESELEFVGASEVLWAYRGALFTEDPDLIIRVRAQQDHALDESLNPACRQNREDALIFYDSVADLILEGLYKQLTPALGTVNGGYVSPERANELRILLTEAGIEVGTETFTIPEQRSAAHDLGVVTSRRWGLSLSPA